MMPRRDDQTRAIKEAVALELERERDEARAYANELYALLYERSEVGDFVPLQPWEKRRLQDEILKVECGDDE